MSGRVSVLLPRPPWLHASADPRVVAAVQSRVQAAGGAVRLLHGGRMRTDREVFAETAAALDFPDYFGHNWPALQDCLTDLAWLPAPAYLLVLDDAHEVLADASPGLVGLFGDVLTDTARWWGTALEDDQEWDRPALAFHVVLSTGDRVTHDRLVRRWREAGVELSELEPAG